jgi:hypothetical protein
VSYVLAILKYYKHDTTDDAFNHIKRIYSEVTFASHIRTRWWMEYGDYNEDDAPFMAVRHRVSEVIHPMGWIKHINHNHVNEIHMPEDDEQCLWKWGCGRWSSPMFCSLMCRVRAELYEFLFRFPKIIAIMDDIDM